MKIPEYKHRDQIERICAEHAAQLGHAVLLLPVAAPIDKVPDAMPPGFRRKDRIGQFVQPSLIAFSPSLGFDSAGLLSISFANNHHRAVGAHLSQHTGGYETDLMARDPNMVRGNGHLLIIDGYGWVGADYDPLLGDAARFTPTVLGESTLLGMGVVDLGDLAGEVRRESDPSMAHYQRPVPIGVA